MNNALIVDICPTQSIIIDPYSQAGPWLKAYHTRDLLSADFTAVSIHNPRFIQIIAAGIKYGKKVLVEKTGEEISLELYPLFDKSMLETD